MMTKTCTCGLVTVPEKGGLVMGDTLHRADGSCFTVEGAKPKKPPAHPEVTRLQAEAILAERQEAVLRQKLAECRRDLDNQRKVNDRLLALAAEDSRVITELQDRVS